MSALRLMAIGNSFGFVLPKDAVARLKLVEGDTVFLIETPDGYRLTPYDPASERQMDKAKDIMKRRRDALRELA